MSGKTCLVCVAVRIENNSVLIVLLQMSGWLGMKSNLCIFAAVIENTVKLENISTAYGRRGATCVTDNFTASLPAGTFVCILGTNGAGKSTLLRTMAGLQPPTSGHIYVNGVELSQYSRRELARMVGVVLTERQAFSAQMTVEELVSLGRIPYTDFSGNSGMMTAKWWKTRWRGQV
ncbi:MAG: ABC transporter ATP-binding protein [Bacteroidaceae bacterium]